MLDGFAAQFRSDHPSLEEMNTRQKALALVRWVRAKNLVGMGNSTENYRNIRNCLIGQALWDPEHPSLPIISSAIYCCIAERIGVRAVCCAVPTHVHTAVLPSPGETLDGKPSSGVGDADGEKMLLDPYGSDDEVTMQHLRERLAAFGWSSSSELEMFLRPSPTTVIVARTAQNLKASWLKARELGDVSAEAAEIKQLRSGDPDLNLESLLYGAMWAGLLVTPTSAEQWDERLESFLGRFVQGFSEDGWLVEQYLIPLYNAFVASRPAGTFRFGWQDARATLDIVRNLDARLPTVSRRYTQEICAKVRYRIGQVFQHKRYGYIGIINGWAPNDTHGLPMPHHMSMDETLDTGWGGGEDAALNITTSRPRRHTFYTCL